ncbi:flagellar protein FlgN [Aquibacillus sediminis]|uniref:flagellar protein FlgN n=1 Tax=Aquibacillus sediminis TaxID=2574734 RepID=UPI001108AFE5|nr:flagellar protein FlgN [Aquibacillus sediminis]
MSVQPIVDVLKKITTLHDNLLSISKKKTESLTKNNIDYLQELLLQERKYVQAINQLETKRMELVENWAHVNGLDSQAITVSVMIDDDLVGTDKQALESVTTRLAETLVELRQQEQLNQQLTKQSMQFIQLTMDMISPSLTTMNYGNQANKQQATQQVKRSLFDSKA